MNLNSKNGTKAHEVEFVSLHNTLLRLNIDGTEHEFDLARESHRLAEATQQQRELFEIFASGYGIHWPAVDEDLSIEGLLRTKKESPFPRS